MNVKSSLSNNKKIELAELQERFKADSIELRDRMKNPESEEERNELKMEAESLREENRSIRSEYKAERKEYINTYREAFIKRIGDRLDKIPTANLEKALEKIDSLLEKVENNTRMSEDAKQTQLDAILALKEIILDRLEADGSDEGILGILEELITE